MSEEPPKIHVDDDWKTEAAREKERLAKDTEGAGPGGPLPAANITELINLLTMQIVVGLGGLQGPGGQTMPPNYDLAKFHIDLLEVLEQKTKGNLAEEESRLLGAVLYDMRIHYVEAIKGATGTATPPSEPEKKS